MYVCNCTAITESQVAQAIENGCVAPEHIHPHCGKSLQCGRCLERMRDILAETESRLIAAE
jgi:bacterioferritin-associated ferredoxin